MTHRMQPVPRVGALAISGLLVSGLFFSATWAAPPKQEPPLRIKLEIGGQSHIVAVGEETALQIAGQSVKLRATLLDTRVFQAPDGLGFAYPRDFSYSYSDSGTRQTWTLSAPGFLISLARWPQGALKADSFLPYLAKRLAEKEPQAEVEVKSVVALGGKVLPGVHVEKHGPGGQVRDYMAFKVADGTYTLDLVRQLDGQGHFMEGSEAAMAVLAESFIFPSAK